MKEDMEDSQKVTIEDFVSTHKVIAFCEAFLPSEVEGPNVEVFNDVRLRKFFEAYPKNIGDPLNCYLDILQRNGFKMRISVQDEPAIFAIRKTSVREKISLDDAFGEGSLYLPESKDTDFD